MFNLNTHLFVLRWDVVFNEDMFPFQYSLQQGSPIFSMTQSPKHYQSSECIIFHVCHYSNPSIHNLGKPPEPIVIPPSPVSVLPLTQSHRTTKPPM